MDDEAGLLVGILGSAFGGKVSLQKVKSFLTLCNCSFTLSRGAFAIEKLFQFVLKYGAKIFEFFVGTPEERALSVLEDDLKFKIMAWINRVRKYDSLEAKAALFVSEEKIQEISELSAEGDRYLQMTAIRGNENLRTALQFTYSTVKELEKQAASARVTSMMRYDTFAFYLCGASGIGKSAAVTKMINRLLQPFDGRKYHYTYTFNPELKHWDGYYGQDAVIRDDFGQYPRVEDLVEEYKTLFAIRTNTAFPVPKADVSDKGMHFSSKLFAMTSNHEYPPAQGAVSNIRALWRRRNITWRMQLASEFNVNPQDEIPEGFFDTLSSEERLNFTHVRFQQLHNFKPNGPEYLIGKPVTFEKMINITQRAFAKHNMAQRELLKDNGAFVPLIARSIVNEKILACSGEVDIDFDTVLTATESENLTQVLIDECQFSAEEAAKIIASARESISTMISKPSFFVRARAQVIRCLNKPKELIDRFMKMCEEHPVLGKIFAVGGLFILYKAIRTLWAMFWGSTEFLEGRMVPSGDLRTGQRVSERSMLIPQPRAYRNGQDVSVRAEGSSDPKADTIVRHVLPKNMYHIWIERNGVAFNKLQCLALGGKMLMCCAHGFDAVHEGDVVHLSDGIVEFKSNFDNKYLVKLRADERTDNYDLVGYEMDGNFPSQKVIIKHFMPANEMWKLYRAEGGMYLRTENGLMMSYGTVEQLKGDVSYVYDNTSLGTTTKRKMLHGWKIHVPSQRGDCGSPLIIYKKGSNGNIAGIHNAGAFNNSFCLASVATRETADLLFRCQLRGRMDVDEIPSEIVAVKGIPTIMPDGNYSHVAVMKNEYTVRIPQKTAIFPSPIHGKISTPKYEPSVLTPDDPRLLPDAESPLVQGLRKEGVSTRAFPTRILNFARFEMFNMLPQDVELDITRDEQWLVNGDGEGTHSMNLASSCGWPYVIEAKGRSGKHWLVEKDEKGYVTLSPRIKHDVNLLWQKWRKETVPFVLVVACTKDELRSKEKVERGNTRLFTVCPLDFTLASRVFFLDFNSAFHKNHCKFFSGCGMDIHSPDLHEMMNYLSQCGRKAFDGDYKNFDGKLQPEVMETVIEMISDWYDEWRPQGIKLTIEGELFEWDALECRKIRRIISNTLIHTYQMIFNEVYQKHQGNPSGNPNTTIINTMVNQMYLMMVYYENHALVVGDFEQHVRTIVYGDDHVVVVDDERIETYNFEVVQRSLISKGIGYTMANKTDDSFSHKDLYECTFLKCLPVFVNHKNFSQGFVRAQIAESTIMELTNWVRGSTQQERNEQCETQCESALQYAWAYGEHYYDDLQRRINVALSEVGLKKNLTTWEQREVAYREKFY